MTSLLQSLVRTSREVGRERHNLVILAEGNTSIRSGETSMLVKVSGAVLARASDEDFVEVDLPALIRLVDSADAASDAKVATVLSQAARTSNRPSVEALLHAVCYEAEGVQAVIHTHPTAVNALLCSDKAELLTAGSLFPDQVVVLGRTNLLVPYVDPGLPLAREVLLRFRRHYSEHGSYPRVIYLRNHGIFSMGSSLEDAFAVTLMATKSAEVLRGAMNAGTVVHLGDSEVDRIDSRPDEHVRRSRLAGQRDSTNDHNCC